MPEIADLDWKLVTITTTIPKWLRADIKSQGLQYNHLIQRGYQCILGHEKRMTDQEICIKDLMSKVRILALRIEGMEDGRTENKL